MCRLWRSTSGLHTVGGARALVLGAIFRWVADAGPSAEPTESLPYKREGAVEEEGQESREDEQRLHPLVAQVLIEPLRYLVTLTRGTLCAQDYSDSERDGRRTHNRFHVVCDTHAGTGNRGRAPQNQNEANRDHHHGLGGAVCFWYALVRVQAVRFRLGAQECEDDCVDNRDAE